MTPSDRPTWDAGSGVWRQTLPGAHCHACEADCVRVVGESVDGVNWRWRVSCEACGRAGGWALTVDEAKRMWFAEWMGRRAQP